MMVRAIEAAEAVVLVVAVVVVAAAAGLMQIEPMHHIAAAG